MSSIGPALFFKIRVFLTDVDFTASLNRCLSFKMVEIVDCQSPNLREMAVTHLPFLCRAIILIFISSEIAFIPFFSPQVGFTEGSFEDMVECENNIQQNAGHTVNYRG